MSQVKSYKVSDGILSYSVGVSRELGRNKVVILAMNGVLFMHRSRKIEKFLSVLFISEFETRDRPSGTGNKLISFLFGYNLALHKVIKIVVIFP
jgi:hypothetical protein